MPSTDDRFYAVTVSNAAGLRSGGRPRDSLVWGPARLTPHDAKRDGAALLAAGKATLAFVVAIGPGRREVLNNFTQPVSVKRILDHYEALWGAIEEGQ